MFFVIKNDKCKIIFIKKCNIKGILVTQMQTEVVFFVVIVERIVVQD